MILTFGPEEYLYLRAVNLKAVEKFIKESNLREDELLYYCLVIGLNGKVEMLFGQEREVARVKQELGIAETRTPPD